ncbi:hypothetical protein Tco_0595898 [Tanacetum coccineum]
MVEKSKLDVDKERERVRYVTLSWFDCNTPLSYSPMWIMLVVKTTVHSTSGSMQLLGDRLLTPFYKAFQASADVPEIYMQEFWATASVHNCSIRFKMNNKKHIVNLEYFREMLQICPIICNQKFDEPTFEQEILTFLNVDYDFLLWEEFTYQVENKNTKKGNVMHEDTQLYGAILPKELTNEDIRNSESYKEKHQSPKDKRVKQTGKMTGSGKQKQPTTGLETLFEITLSETEQLKIATKRSTDEGVGDKPEVPNVPEHHSNSKEESCDPLVMLIGDNIIIQVVHSQHDDQEEQDDEEEQEEDDEDEEEISDQLVCTPSNYQTANESEKQKDNDKVKDGEEDKERDLTNVNLEGGDVDMTDADHTKTGSCLVTITASYSHCLIQSSSVSDLVSKFISPTMDEGIDSILTPHTKSTTLVNVPIFVATETPATTTTIPPPLFPVIQSSQQTPVTTTTITNPSTTPLPIPNFASVFGFNQRVTALESDLSKLKQSNPFAKSISSILGIVNEYLGSKMKEAVDKIIKDQVKTQTSKIKSKVEKYVTESLGAEVLIRSTNQPQASYGIASSLSELELKRILMDKMEENKSIDISDVYRNLYNALVEAYNTDKDLLSSYGDVIIIPTTRDDKDKDEEPSARSTCDQEMEISKEDESS